ncbi:hypothetical protein [Mucilaginibacter defluvii]|uniref:Fimbrillin-A associated anchor protein Mfa1/Mfa2 n=1 Tax=Mucilaginibacter defluvii TaxID=1196019 RepID=A0ABP9FL29_9SPHI
MKKPLLLCSVLALLLFACKKGSKDTPTPTDEKKYAVTFSVSGFEQHYEPLDKKKPIRILGINDVDTSQAERMVYWLYKASDKRDYLSHRSTRKSDGNFGVYREYLAPGNYLAYFVAGGNMLAATENKSRIGYSDDNLLLNTFRAVVPITVTNTPIETHAELTRITSELIVNIEDAIPADVTKIQLTYARFTSFNITSSPVPVVNYSNPTKKVTEIDYTTGHYQQTKNVTAADVGTTNLQFKSVTLGTENPYILTLKYYKSDPNTPFDTKVIPNVICKANYRTLVSGKLFTPKNTGFTITVDDEWDEPVNGGF